MDALNSLSPGVRAEPAPVNLLACFMGKDMNPNIPAKLWHWKQKGDSRGKEEELAGEAFRQ